MTYEKLECQTGGQLKTRLT